jgi:NhaP-type Na+/H+ or K+/H+ antiporter
MASELADQVARRVTIAMIASNAAGALVVFVFANAVLPIPPHLHHTLRLFLINVGAFVVAGACGLGYAWVRSLRLWKRRMEWAAEDGAQTNSNAIRRC